MVQYTLFINSNGDMLTFIYVSKKHYYIINMSFNLLHMLLLDSEENTLFFEIVLAMV